MGMLLRARLLLLSLMQRLRRSIWLRRSRRLTRLTERQLKSLWKMKNLSMMLGSMQAEEAMKEMALEELRAPLPMNMEPDQMEQMLADLQTSSRQLTSMLSSRTS